LIVNEHADFGDSPKDYTHKGEKSNETLDIALVENC
jgi:hypothetical protein